MSLVIDVVLIVLIGFVIFKSYQQGFLSSILDTFSVAIAGVLAYMFSSPVAEKVYDMFVKELVKTRFTRVLDDVSANLSISEKVKAMIEGLPPTAVKLAEATGLNVSDIGGSLAVNNSMSNEQIVDVVVDQVGYDIMIAITEFICFIALFLIATIAIKFISKLFVNANKLPVIKTINGLLGGVVGVVKAAVILFVVCTLIYFLGATTGGEFGDAVSESYVCSFVNGVNPIVSLFK